VRFDTWAAHELHEEVFESRWVVGPLQVISFLGHPLFLTAVVVAACLWLLHRRFLRLTVFLATTSGGGALIDLAVKHAVHRPRPSLTEPVATASGQSFPSGHSMNSAIIYGALLVIFLPALARRARGWAVAGVVVMVAAIGWSRLALGVHYISDILGAFALGLAWLAASMAALSTWRQERPPQPRRRGQGGPTSGAELDGVGDPLHVVVVLGPVGRPAGHLGEAGDLDP
jgi:undecaprenyl-diphosphatase